MKHTLLIYFLIISGLSSLVAQDLFDDTTPLEFRMVLDIPEIQANRHDSAPYISAQIQYKHDQELVAFKAKVRPRGNFRLKPAVCAFPPLKVRIEKSERKGTLFAHHKTLKLVTHCSEEELIHKEYLVYKMYQQLSPYHFKVRLARITYIDRSGQILPEKHWAFFIEDDDRMAKRLGGDKLEDPIELTEADLDRQATTLLYGFAYFVGNLDWNFYEPKNMDFVQLTTGPPIPVPYDFDLSEVVNVPYAGITDDFDRRVMKRICRTEAEYQAVIDLFVAERESLFLLVDASAEITSVEKGRIKGMMRSFYREIKKGKLMETWLAACPG